MKREGTVDIPEESGERGKARKLVGTRREGYRGLPTRGGSRLPDLGVFPS